MTTTDVAAAIISLRSQLRFQADDHAARAQLADAYEDAGRPGLAARQRRLLEARPLSRPGRRDRAEMKLNYAECHNLPIGVVDLDVQFDEELCAWTYNLSVPGDEPDYYGVAGLTDYPAVWCVEHILTVSAVMAIGGANG